MSRYRGPVGDAIKRRLGAGLCLVCGGKLVRPKLLREGELACINKDDGRHGGRGRRILRKK